MIDREDRRVRCFAVSAFLRARNHGKPDMIYLALFAIAGLFGILDGRKDGKRAEARRQINDRLSRIERL